MTAPVGSSTSRSRGVLRDLANRNAGDRLHTRVLYDALVGLDDVIFPTERIDWVDTDQPDTYGVAQRFNAHDLVAGIIASRTRRNVERSQNRVIAEGR